MALCPDRVIVNESMARHTPVSGSQASAGAVGIGLQKQPPGTMNTRPSGSRIAVCVVLSSGGKSAGSTEPDAVVESVSGSQISVEIKLEWPLSFDPPVIRTRPSARIVTAC